MNIDLNQYFEKQKKFSGNVLLAQNNKIIWNESYGYADRERGIRNSPQTKFLIGSMTKPITAICIMQLSEKGMLSVQQNLEDFFPDLYKGQGITIHHLLTHTSGIPDFLALRKQIKWEEHHTPQEILQIVKGSKLKFPAGAKWSYANTNYLILGLIIEMVSGMRYHQYVRENIFVPAGMEHSGFADENQENTARGYIAGARGFYIDPSLCFACGDVVTTAYDFFLLDKALADGKLLQLQSIQEMHKPHYDGKIVKYGYGFMIKRDFDCISICHSGSLPNGYTSHYEKYIADDITIIVLSNDFVNYPFLLLTGAGGTYISREIASLIYGKKVGILKKIF